jgi:2-phosphoglycerate kinase
VDVALGGPAGESPTLPARLAHVCWIGGGSGAGKSTIARRLADRHGLRLYSTDAVMAEHARRSTRQDAPLLHEFMQMSMDARWVDRSPVTMLETFQWFRGEGFALIVDDLLRLPPGAGVIAEGFRLLPRLVRPLLADRDRAVWLLPTPEFRRAAFAGRGGLWDIPRRTSDPETALRNLLDRDRMFTDLLAAQTRRLGLASIAVDGTMSEQDLAARVSGAFGLGAGQLP